MVQIIASFESFTFEGSRSCAAATAAARDFFPFIPEGSQVRTGCAHGVDAATRRHFAAAQVYAAAAFGSGRGAFAARSAALIRDTHEATGLLLAFPSGTCPAAVKPRKQFAGHGSGTWGGIAYAIGLGCAVLVCITDGSTPPHWLGQPVQAGASQVYFIQARDQKKLFL